MNAPSEITPTKKPVIRCGQRKPLIKATNFVVNERIELVAGMLARGCDNRTIRLTLQRSPHNLSYRQCAEYVARARTWLHATATWCILRPFLGACRLDGTTTPVASYFAGYTDQTMGGYSASMTFRLKKAVTLWVALAITLGFIVAKSTSFVVKVVAILKR